MSQHLNPCKECPWRRRSLPGYLGQDTPVDFAQASEEEQRMPCHMAVDFSDPQWQEQVADAPQCAGRAIFFANRVKVPRRPDLLQLPPDRHEVFGSVQEFIDHHSCGKGPQVVVVGTQILEVK